MACKVDEELENIPDSDFKYIISKPASEHKPGVITPEILEKASLFNQLSSFVPGPVIDPTPPVISLPIEVERNLPSFKEMAFGITESLKSSLTHLAMGGAVFANKEETEKRMNLCLNCEFLIPAKSRCSKCGCFMNVKTRLQTSKCPIDKW